MNPGKVFQNATRFYFYFLAEELFFFLKKTVKLNFNFSSYISGKPYILCRVLCVPCICCICFKLFYIMSALHILTHKDSHHNNNAKIK